MFCLPLWFWLPKNVYNLDSKSHGNHWLSISHCSCPDWEQHVWNGWELCIERRWGMKSSAIHCNSLMIFAYSRFTTVAYSSAVSLSPFDAASCPHWSFSSTTLAYYDCRIRLVMWGSLSLQLWQMTYWNHYRTVCLLLGQHSLASAFYALTWLAVDVTGGGTRPEFGPLLTA